MDHNIKHDQLAWLQENGCSFSTINEIILVWQNQHGTAAPFGLKIKCGCSLGAGCNNPAEHMVDDSIVGEELMVCDGCFMGFVNEEGHSKCDYCGNL